MTVYIFKRDNSFIDFLTSVPKTPIYKIFNFNTKLLEMSILIIFTSFLLEMSILVYFSFDRRIDVLGNFNYCLTVYTPCLVNFMDKPFNLKARRNNKGKQKAGYLKIYERIANTCWFRL